MGYHYNPNKKWLEPDLRLEAKMIEAPKKKKKDMFKKKL